MELTRINRSFNKDTKNNLVEFKSTKDRLYYFLDQIGVSQPEFQKNTGLSNSYVSTMGDSPNQKTRDLISGAYKDLNIDWLITGKGKMRHSDPDEPSPAQQAIEALISASIAIKKLEERIIALENNLPPQGLASDEGRRNAHFDSASSMGRGNKSKDKDPKEEKK